MKIEFSWRDPDEFDEHRGIGPHVCGFYAHGHVPKLAFLEEIFASHPLLCVYPICVAWIAIAARHGHYAAEHAWVPSTRDVIHTHWRMRKGYYARAKPNSRGSYPVTCLQIEGDDWGTHTIWDEGLGRWTIQNSHESDRVLAGAERVRAFANTLIHQSAIEGMTR